jgi:hypothetical protein
MLAAMQAIISSVLILKKIPVQFSIVYSVLNKQFSPVDARLDIKPKLR